MYVENFKERKIGKYSGSNTNENTTYQHLRDISKAEFMGKFIPRIPVLEGKKSLKLCTLNSRKKKKKRE